MQKIQILNSITYGLYGTTFDTLKKEKNRDNKFINNNNKKDNSLFPNNKQNEACILCVCIGLDDIMEVQQIIII